MIFRILLLIIFAYLSILIDVFGSSGFYANTIFAGAIFVSIILVLAKKYRWIIILLFSFCYGILLYQNIALLLLSALIVEIISYFGGHYLTHFFLYKSVQILGFFQIVVLLLIVDGLAIDLVDWLMITMVNSLISIPIYKLASQRYITKHSYV